MFNLKKKIGIIGGKGFLGKNLEHFLKQKLSYSVLIAGREELSTAQQMQEFVESVESVIYLAHEGGPSQTVPLEEDLERNLVPLERFIEAMKNALVKPRSVIYLSSGGTVYGVSKNEIPWKEEDSLQPVHNYAKVKIAAEALLKEASDQRKFRCICIRAGNPYGNFFNHEKPQGVIDVIISCLVSEKPFLLYDSKDTVRDYVHLDDLNQAIVNSIEFLENKKSGFEIFNIASGAGTSLAQIIQKIETLSGKKLQLTERAPDLKAAPISWSILDISKAKEKLNWTPKISLESGLKELIQRKVRS